MEQACRTQISQSIFALCVSCVSDAEHFKTLEVERESAAKNLSVFLDRVSVAAVDLASIRAMTGTTLLTWSDKAGIIPEVKAVLGRHARSVQGTEAIYNRDLSASRCSLQSSRQFPRGGAIPTQRTEPSGWRASSPLSQLHVRRLGSSRCCSNLGGRCPSC